jgi:hypothetical protein
MHKRNSEGPDYLAYLMRLWVARDSEGAQVWRASLQVPGTVAPRVFADLETLIAFLREQTAAPTIPETQVDLSL